MRPIATTGLDLMLDLNRVRQQKKEKKEKRAFQVQRANISSDTAAHPEWSRLAARSLARDGVIVCRRPMIAREKRTRPYCASMSFFAVLRTSRQDSFPTSSLLSAPNKNLTHRDKTKMKTYIYHMHI